MDGVDHVDRLLVVVTVCCVMDRLYTDNSSHLMCSMIVLVVVISMCPVVTVMMVAPGSVRPGGDCGEEKCD